MSQALAGVARQPRCTTLSLQVRPASLVFVTLSCVQPISASTIAYSGVADIALALLPWFLLAKLQMRTSEKIGTAVAMSCGVL